jgi:CBS domain-containing protein
MDELFEDVESYAPDPPERPARSLEEVALDQPIRTLVLRDLISLDSSRPAAEAIQMMRDHRSGSVLVTSGERVVGIFTERDVLTKIALGEVDPVRTPLAQVMRPRPETLTLDDPMAYALNVMILGGFRHVPLVDGAGRPVGVVSVRDIVRYLVDQFPHKVLNIPPRPGGDIARSREGA